MKAKKSTNASLKGRNILFFLVGLNIVLLGVWFLFDVKTSEITKTEIAVVDDEPNDNRIPNYLFPEPEIPEPEIPEPEPLPEPKIFEEIEETDKPVEDPVTLNEPDIKTAATNSSTPGTKEPTEIDLTGIKENAEKNNNEEREIDDIYSPNRVAEMAIYPGCEKFKTKKSLLDCFGTELSKDIIGQLDAEYPDVEKDAVSVLLEFHVNTQGEIVNVKPTRGDEEFKLQAKQALEKVSDRLIKKGKKITPAKLEGGEEVILKFQRAVKLQKP